MILKWNDPTVRLTGRWSRNDPNMTTATANGSYFEFAFRGRVAIMHFDTLLCSAPFPHLYVEIDGGNRVEVPLDRHLRIFAQEADANHVARVILKGSVEMQPRWYPPLVGCTSLIGIDVEERGVLPADERRIIEFVGDSITEGVLIDADYSPTPAHTWDQHNRIYQDDSTATYAWLTAEQLNLRPIMMGYGAVGTTRGGCGGVVRAADAYPYVFDKVPYEGESPDYVVINHGTNDRGQKAEIYLSGYEELLNAISEKHPHAVLVAMSPFCGAFARELKEFCKDYSERHRRTVHYIDGSVWLPPEPVHPLREGHRIAAEHLTKALKAIIDSEK